LHAAESEAPRSRIKAAQDANARLTGNHVLEEAFNPRVLMTQESASGCAGKSHGARAALNARAVYLLLVDAAEGSLQYKLRIELVSMPLRLVSPSANDLITNPLN